MENLRLIDATEETVLDYGICGYKNLKRPGYPEKIEWLKARFKEGMKVKVLYSDTDGTQGMIEYIPGEYCWRPVYAAGYLFIHCIFVGFKREYKGKGYASLLVDDCMLDAKKDGKLGVVVVTRKGSFMVGRELFIKNGFESIDTAPPDFELLVKKFDAQTPSPKFKDSMAQRLSNYSDALTIIRADQCPYTVKNVAEICETAKKTYGIKPKVINLKNCTEAQNNPCPFGTFCIIYNGEIIAHHPISNGRFKNIMRKLVKEETIV